MSCNSKNKQTKTKQCLLDLDQKLTLVALMEENISGLTFKSFIVVEEKEN